MNVPKGLSFIRLTNWLRCKSAMFYLQNNDGRPFHYASPLIQHYKEIKYHHERVKDTKFFYHYNCNEITYQTPLNNFRKFERNNKDIAFVLLFVDVVIKMFQDEVFVKQYGC